MWRDSIHQLVPYASNLKIGNTHFVGTRLYISSQTELELGILTFFSTIRRFAGNNKMIRGMKRIFWWNPWALFSWEYRKKSMPLPCYVWSICEMWILCMCFHRNGINQCHSSFEKKGIGFADGRIFYSISVFRDMYVGFGRQSAKWTKSKASSIKTLNRNPCSSILGNTNKKCCVLCELWAVVSILCSLSAEKKRKQSSIFLFMCL